MIKHLTYVVIDADAAADCARCIERAIKNNWFEDAAKAQAVADALWALTNDTDCIVTDADVIPEENDK